MPVLLDLPKAVLSSDLFQAIFGGRKNPTGVECRVYLGACRLFDGVFSKPLDSFEI